MRRRNTALIISIIAVVVIIVTLLAAYLLGRAYYATHFYGDTKINGFDMGNLTASQAVDKLSGHVRDYILRVETYQGDSENLLGPDFDLDYLDDGSIQALVDAQDENSWLFDFRDEYIYEVKVGVVLDEIKLRRAFSSLHMTDEDEMKAPVDAHIAMNEDTGSYELVPEDDGNVLHVSDAFEVVKAAAYERKESVMLEGSLFDHAAIRSDNDELVACMENISAYFGTEIEYELGDDTEILDSATIQSWLTVGDDYSVTVDEDKVEKYVQYLATKYNTFADRREFKTSLGDVITIGGGDYGWVVNKPAEKDQILEDLRTGGRISREMVYEQRAMVPGLDDIGDTYVEIDYTNQHLYYYEDGNLIYDTDTVTGNLNRGNGSPDGVYKIVYMERNATLVGEGYSSPVSYFMPFAYNVGIHDATWRSSFGGEIYLSNGSHGCVNVSYEAAETLFGMLKKGIPVVAYYRDDVILTADNARISGAYSYVSPEKLEEMQQAEAEAAAAGEPAAE